MASKGRGAFRGSRLRATRLDGCGRVVYGDASQGVSKGFVSVAWTANTTEIAAIEQQNANGDPCIFEPAKTRLTGYTVNMVFCEVDPELFSLITGQRVYVDENGDAIGFAINTDVDLADQGFALEVWAGAPAGDACDDDNAEGEFGYFLAPYLQGGILSDYTIENGAINFTISNAVTRDGNRWGSGPYNVMRSGGVASPLLTPLQRNDHKLLIWVTVAPPEAFYGTRPVLDPESTAITGVTAAAGESPTVADFTFAGASADTPVWIEFGDGEWDYVADASSGSSHEYAANGTYTVRATANGRWVTTQVTIPLA